VAARVSLRLLQIGAVLIVIAVTAQDSFDLDRFLVPKELVLHLTALLAGLTGFRLLRRLPFSGLDAMLVAFLAISVVSTIFATNLWAGLRALALTGSALLLFWLARAHAERRDAIVRALAVGVVLAAGISLLQAYGVRLDLFAQQRAPGGTLGNRNFVAHAAAFGSPLVWLTALRARRMLLPLAGSALLAGALVLTRSRAAWLGFAAMSVVFLLALLLSAVLRRDGVTWRRLVAIVLFCGAGVTAALLVPNTLRWNSDNPYVDSVKDVANYKEGSGRGRLLQYERSMILAFRNPILGVGPGNWPVRYPAVVERNDPSLDPSTPGMTYNPWPSSDWVAYVTERGWVGGLLLLAVLARIAWISLRRARTAPSRDEALDAVTLLALLAATVLVGTFDAVLLLAFPAFIVWLGIGALSPQPVMPVDAPIESPRLTPVAPLLLVLVVSAVGTLRSGGQLVAMELLEQGRSLRTAAWFDPGNYRLHMRLARSGKRAERCEHAIAARTLFPSSQAARAVSRGCE
jgi:hypothetical protein